ncbi:MAG: aminoglycoside phosphotransferase family protein [Chloroflexota bacterium]
MSDPNQKIIAEITEEIQARIPDWYGKGVLVSSRSPVLRTSKKSYFLDYHLRPQAGKPVKLMVKIPRQRNIEMTLPQTISAEDLIQKAKLEYEMLQSVFEKVAIIEDPHLRAIRVWGYLPRWNAIVMEELQTKTMLEILAGIRMRLGVSTAWRSFEETMMRAGKWLRHLHGPPDELAFKPFDYDEMCSYVEMKMGQWKEVPRLKVKVPAIQEAFANVLLDVKNERVPVATLHGDFTLTNLIVSSDGSISGIDLDKMSVGPVYLDLVRLIADFSLREAVRLGYFFHHEHLCASTSAFLRGYFETHSPNWRLLNVYCAKEAINIISWFEKRINGTTVIFRIGGGIYFWWMRRYVHKMLNQYLTPV